MKPRALKSLFRLELNPDTCMELNLSADNPDLKFIDSAEKLGRYIQQKVRQESRLYAIGGYGENRKIYSRFKHFDTEAGKRCIHLGVDFWAEAGTPVFCPADGKVHSFSFNDNPGDYGAILILEHSQNGKRYYSLYGHISLKDLDAYTKGQEFKAGELLCHLGALNENGHWPPHLHFQLIKDLEGNSGDYPGVVEAEEAEHYLNNCPNPRSFFYQTEKH